MISIANELVKNGTKKEWGIKLYKYVPVLTTKIVHKKKIKEARDDMRIDLSNIVLLGGTFEKVGGEDEVVGGGTQKVG